MNSKTTKKDEPVRFIPVGGFEEIGRNMMAFEYKDEIILIDMGLQFPEEETPGIDFIIPNTSYFEPKRQNIKAVILTHAHYDHIGAIPYLSKKLGNPPIYTTALTKEIINKRQEEFLNAPKLNVRVIKNGDVVKFSDHFEAKFFAVPHNIPDTTAVILRTPAGNFANLADVKIDYDAEGKPTNLEEFRAAAKEKIHVLFLDSTRAEAPGRSLSEKMVEKNLEELFQKAEGRIIIGTFASLLTRIAEIIKIAEKMNKKVAISGRSMKENIEISRNLGYIKPKKGTIIPIEDIHKYNDDKVMVLSTGAQGEPKASLMRISNGEHKYITIKPGDTVIFSSSVIPGNERSVQILKDNLARQGAIVYHSEIVDIHSSGHASQDELRDIIRIMDPKFFVPIHGYFFMRSQNALNGVESGVPKENIFLPDNGQVMEITKTSAKITDKTIPASYVLVDGLGVGDVGEVVLRDRRLLAQEGMIVIIATVSRRDGRLVKNPDIISRGFIYLKENQKLLEDIRTKTRGIVSRIPRHQPLDGDYLKSLFRDQIGQFVYNKTNRRPMILPVIIEV
ncbi:MAG TPA: ribonuclease J [Candidatus Colwellbacteria bacterium]|nr:ribonuclease J [Candidatus Colwellbacteria bacterium]